jgi:hypothetical protein
MSGAVEDVYDGMRAVAEVNGEFGGLPFGWDMGRAGT